MMGEHDESDCFCQAATVIALPSPNSTLVWLDGVW